MKHIAMNLEELYPLESIELAKTGNVVEGKVGKPGSAEEP